MNLKSTSIASLLAVVTIASSAAVAQLVPSGQETLRTTVGSIFEIQSVGGQGKISWVLTQNGEFVEANRETVFRTRFSQPGSFVLSAETEMAGETIQRSFRIAVQDRKPGDEAPTSNGSAIATYTPPLQKGSIRISQNSQVITITPERKDIKVIAIDTDTKTDSNNDGNPQNDDDTKNTLFRSEGSPLNLWIVNGQPREMRIGVLFSNKDVQFESISVTKGGNAPPVSNEYNDSDTIEEAPDGMKIQVLKSDNGEVQFGLQMDSEEKSAVLLLWNFGDGQQSMLDKPIHIFAESGKYDVSVEIRDLKTGVVKDSVSDDLVINRMIDESDPAVPTTITKPEKEKREGGSILGLILKLLLTLIASGAVGAAILFLVGKLKKKGFSLEKSLEKAEGAIVKTPKETVAETAPPMEIISEPEVVATVTPEVVEATPVPEAELVTPEPATKDSEPAPIPEWLEPKPQPEVTTPTPEPTPVVEPEVVAVTPVAEPVVTPEPVVVEQPAPNVEHTAMEPATEELTTDPEKAPEWLQDGIEKAKEEGQTVDAPPPEELQGDAPAEVPLTTNDVEKEERLKEKKRQKRQRYRENVKSRKDQPQTDTPVEENSEPMVEAPIETPSEAVDMDEPVAFIKAEDIEPMEPEEKQGS